MRKANKEKQIKSTEDYIKGQVLSKIINFNKLQT